MHMGDDPFFRIAPDPSRAAAAATAAPAPRRPAYKTTRFQWVCVTLMVCAALLFSAWFIQAFFDYKVRLRAATCVWPAPAPAPAPATTTNVAITNGSPAGRLLAELSSTVRGLLAQDAALPAAAAAAENLPLLAPPPP
ncbi:hypothetical protein V8C40DRAFT_268487 [Trichoderma camerunense]